MAERLWIWRRVATLKMKRLSKPQSLQWEQEIWSAREPFFTVCVSEFPEEGSSSHPFVFSAPWSLLLCDGHWLLGNKNGEDTKKERRERGVGHRVSLRLTLSRCTTHLPYQYSKSHSVIKQIFYWPRHRLSLEIQFVLFEKKKSFESLPKVFVWNSSVRFPHSKPKAHVHLPICRLLQTKVPFVVSLDIVSLHCRNISN